MNPEDFVEIGYISKAHGIKGEVRAVFDVYDLLEYLDSPIFVLGKKGKNLQPYVVEAFKVQTAEQSILKFQGIASRNDAEGLVGYTLFYPEEELPALEEGHFYYFEVIGFTVVDEEKGKLGTVQAFADGPVQDVLIMEYQGHEVLIPVVDHIVGLADFEKEEVSVNLPEGLLALYMGIDDQEEEE
ncbi:MAG: ribosome maturation factor RimM [Bacteroidota bacterium]